MAFGSIVGGILGAGASLIGAGQQSSAARQAAGLSAEATQLAVQEQRRQFDLTRADFAPWREAGQAALSRLSAMFLGTPETQTVTETTPGDPSAQARLLQLREQYAQMPEMLPIDPDRGVAGGMATNNERVRIGQEIAALEAQAQSTTTMRTVPVEGTGGAPDYSEFYKSPGYQFRMDEGVRALDRSAASRGRLRGGAHERGLIRYGQGVASDEFNNYANRLATMAGMGQTATGSTAAAGAQAAGGISNALMSGAANQGNALIAAGTARASGYAGAANNLLTGYYNNRLFDLLEAA